MRFLIIHPNRFALVCGLFVFLWTAGLHQERFDNPTAVSRQDLLHAVTVKGVWNIDDYHENTPDKAFARGHYFSDKAPGTVLVTLPTYLVSVSLLNLFGWDTESRRAWQLLSWLSAASVLAVFLGAATWVAVDRLAKRLGLSNAWIVVAGVLLGGMPVVYSTILFSHGLVVSCLILAAGWLGLLDNSRPTRRSCVLAGLMLGLALASEYTSGLVIVAIIVCLLLRGGWNRLRWLVLGGIGPVLTIPAYSWITIGSPLKLPYSFQAYFMGMHEGLYGIKWPSLKLAWIFLFSPERGLFLWSPVLLLCLLGFGYLFQRDRQLFWVTYLGCVIHVVVLSGRDFEWLAGISFGPRLLAPVLVLLLLPLAFAAEHHRAPVMLLTAVSIALTGFAVLTNSMSYGERDPWRDVMITAYNEARGALTVWQALGIPQKSAFWLHYGLLLLGTGLLYVLGARSTQVSENVLNTDRMSGAILSSGATPPSRIHPPHMA